MILLREFVFKSRIRLAQNKITPARI